MTEQQTPQIYLATPRQFDLNSFAQDLPRVLDKHDIACVRLDLDSSDAGDVKRAADVLRDICHAREVALVIKDHVKLVTPHGLDGVHLSDGPRQLRDTRKDLGTDAIIGCHCGASRHAGMTAGEIGADYVAFGPLSLSTLGHEEVAEYDLFDWWAMMIEVPVVAEGGLTTDVIKRLSQSADFFCFGDEVWSHPDGAIAAMDTLTAAMA